MPGGAEPAGSAHQGAAAAPGSHRRAVWGRTESSINRLVV